MKTLAENIAAHVGGFNAEIIAEKFDIPVHDVRAAYATHRASEAWAQVMRDLAVATGKPNDSDDEGMRDASAHDLILWVADLENRVGLCVDDLRHGIFDYCDIRDSALAESVIREAFPDSDCIVPHDPRGISVAGAERERDSAGDYRPLGLYLEDNGTWTVGLYCDDTTENFSVCDGAGNLDRALAVKTLRELASMDETKRAAMERAE